MTRRNPGVVLRGDRNECPGCNELFNSSYAFDKHRTGKFNPGPLGRRCMTVPEMLAKGMVKNAAGFWVSEALPEKGVSSRGETTRSDDHAA